MEEGRKTSPKHTQYAENKSGSSDLTPTPLPKVCNSLVKFDKETFPGEQAGEQDQVAKPKIIETSHVA